MKQGTGSSHRLAPRLVASGFGVALLLGSIETVKAYLAGRDAPNDFGWSEATLANLPWWLLWAALAIPIFVLVRRFPLERGRWPRTAAVHVAASAAFSALHLSVSAFIVWSAVSHDFLSLAEQSRQLLVGYFLTDVVTYWAIVAAYSVRASHLRLQDAERRQRELQLRNARLEAESSRARLEALRRELNPHFLFNTLNCISALASGGRGDAAVTAVARLSDLLRTVLDDDLDEQVSLEEELELLGLYLDILDLRYGDRLSVEIRADPVARSALVPTLILQPLVENAIKYGLERVRGRGMLSIVADVRGERLEVRVRNSGPRLAPGLVSRELEAGEDGGGLGLRNVRGRVHALFGEDAEVSLRSLPAGGAEALLDIPLVVEREVRLLA